MKTSVDGYSFRRAFNDLRPDNFTCQGLNILFDYFEALEDDLGEEIDFDVIAICCDYSEDTIDEIANNYSIDLSECEDDDEKRDAVRSYLEDNTAICGETDAGFVYACF